MISNLHPTLNFTCEVENNEKLPFLDMCISNDNGILSSYWYRKPTDACCLLLYSAYCCMVAYVCSSVSFQIKDSAAALNAIFRLVHSFY